MGERLLVAFIPQKNIVKNLNKIRKIAGIKLEMGSGLRTPHITIVDNSYSSARDVDKVLRKIAKEHKPFDARIEGINSFVVKKNLKINKYQENDSLIYLIEDNAEMKNFRKEILEKLNRLKTSERVEQWKKENPNISKTALVNVKKYGTAFGLSEWKFHTTIGLIPKSEKKKLLEKIKKLNVLEDWRINQFGLFVRKNGWVLFKKYQLSSK